MRERLNNIQWLYHHLLAFAIELLESLHNLHIV